MLCQTKAQRLSTAHDTLLGLPGVVIERVDRKKIIHVWAKPS
jgi:nitrate reductase NapAB chaperone NapD